MPNIGLPELIVVLVVALLVLGPGKLPEVGASLGKSIREFRKATTDLEDTVNINQPLPSYLASRPSPPNAPSGTDTRAPSSSETDAQKIARLTTERDQALADLASAARDVTPRGTPVDPVADSD